MMEEGGGVLGREGSARRIARGSGIAVRGQWLGRVRKVKRG